MTTPAIPTEVVDAARVLAAHGYEWGDGLEMLHCDCGWTIDGYIDHEDGLPERDGDKAGYDGREIAAIVRHRAHVATELAAGLAAAKADALEEAADEIYGDHRPVGVFDHPLSVCDWLRERATNYRKES